MVLTPRLLLRPMVESGSVSNTCSASSSVPHAGTAAFLTLWWCDPTLRKEVLGTVTEVVELPLVDVPRWWVGRFS